MPKNAALVLIRLGRHLPTRAVIAFSSALLVTAYVIIAAPPSRADLPSFLFTCGDPPLQQTTPCNAGEQPELIDPQLLQNASLDGGIYLASATQQTALHNLSQRAI
ncbi:MAG: hypothetical protein JO147_01505, partial [Actinobacteria bacterium]|nr:hypothetical protein [Actinomycetota bacterium]